MAKEVFDCLIIGGGPAGLSSALYCARANLNCAIIDKSALGGTPVNYCEIENYLGFNKIQGFELCEKFEQHLDEFKIQKLPYEEIQSVELSPEIKKISTLSNTYLTKSIIIATGAKNKKLNIKGEDEFYSKGVSYCAVCDSAFYKDKEVAVIGGGNSALEEANYLTRFAKKVYLIHRRDAFRADKIIQKRIEKNNKIEPILNSIPVEIIGKDKVEALKIKNNLSNKITTLELQGIFPYIGIIPNSELFLNEIKTDEYGFILTDENKKTNIEGVYAAGDIRKTPLRQVITAVSDGAVAGYSVSKYLEKIKDKLTVKV